MAGNRVGLLGWELAAPGAVRGCGVVCGVGCGGGGVKAADRRSMPNMARGRNDKIAD